MAANIVGKPEANANWLNAFMTPLGYAGMYVNLAANQVYTDFIGIVLVLYAIFIAKYLRRELGHVKGVQSDTPEWQISRQKSGTSQIKNVQDEKGEARRILKQAGRRVMQIVLFATISCLLAVATSLLAFSSSIIHHAVAISLCSFVSASLCT